MKKTFLTFSFLLTFIFISCGDDDSPNESEQGTWRLVNRVEVGDDADSVVLDCEKLTTYIFQNNTVESTVYDSNDTDDDCVAPESSTLNYKIEDSFLIVLDDEGNAIDTKVNVEITVLEEKMILVFRDPNDSPTSALKSETFERQ
ncbi:lipocalin family protein [Aquimarina sp. ERC-38]|uniref:lipocalin family protein n=1 Tax=Aquimarina sp. ERC-38 TaxID=2949996 RepID=UPI00224537D8|nr:lipocalin family protein [Aquimarina sp. ERC-38]UZO81643.1 lipocalin family protein [Aquimarina sp. ERC-38]